MLEPKPFRQADLYGRLRGPARRLYYRLLDADVALRSVNRAYIREFRRDPPALSGVGQRVVADLRRDGIAQAHISEFADPALFDEFSAAFQDLVRAHEAGEKKGLIGKKSYILRLGDATVALRNDDPTSRLILQPGFAAVAAHYMGMVPRFSGTRLWRTLPTGDAERVASQQWHRDYNDGLFTKVFLYLNDVGEEAGPLEYVKGSHRAGPFGKVLRYQYNSQGARDYLTNDDMRPFLRDLEPSMTKAVGKAGTLTFVDTYGFHRGGKCLTGTRDVFIMHYNTNAAISPAEFVLADDLELPAGRFASLVYGQEGARPVSAKSKQPEAGAM